MIAAEVIPPEALVWVMGVIVTGILSVFGFLARNAFSKVESGIDRLEGKLDALKEGLGRSDTRVAVLEARVAAQDVALAEMRREMRELSEGIAR